METHANNSSLRPGEMLNWYRIGRVLGRGGFGITYLAHDSNLHTDVAIKEYLPTAIAQRAGDNSVNPNTEDDESTFNWGLASFLEEARTLVRFKHPNIVRVLTVFEANGTAYMVMEFEHGRDLKKLLSQSELPDEDYLKKLMTPIIEGLSEVHRHGFIHRDIKPANIYIRDDNTPVLLDFGSARLALNNATQHLTALVSVGFTPLEQYGDASGQQQGPWSDIYALAAVLYFAIVGNPPPDSTLRASAILNNKPDPLQPISLISQSRYSTNFLAAIDWALGFKVSERPQTLDAWRTVLFADDRTVLRSRVATNRSYPNSGVTSGLTVAFPQRPEAQRAITNSLEDRASDPQLPRDQLFDETNWKIPRSTQKSTQQSGPKRSMHARAPFWILLVTVAVSTVGYWQWQQISEKELGVVPVRAEFDTNTGQQQDMYSAESATLVLPKPSTDQEAKTAGEVEFAAEQARESEAARERETELVAEQAREITTAREAELAAIQAREANAAREAELAAVKAREAKAAREAELAAIKAREANAAREAELAAVKAREANAAREAEFAAIKAREAKAAREVELAAVKAREAKAAREAELAAVQAREAKAAKEAILARQQAREAEAVRKAELGARQARETEAARQAKLVVQPITDAEIQTTASRFNELMKTIRSRDMERLRNLTSSSTQYEGLFQYWFTNFESIEVQLSGISANRTGERVNALLTVSQLVRSNGDIVLPAKSFQLIPIHSARSSGNWSKIQWSISGK